MKLMLIGFPKSGTTTISKALEAGGLRAAHWLTHRQKFVGMAIYEGYFRHGAPFHLLAGYDAVTQADVCLPSVGVNYWPNLDLPLLREVRRLHPECALVLNYRDPERTAESMMGWADFSQRLTACDVPGLPRGFGSNRDELVRWIEAHHAACREAFAGDPKFVEIDIEDPDAPAALARAAGCEIGPWGRANRNRGGPPRIEIALPDDA